MANNMTLKMFPCFEEMFCPVNSKFDSLLILILALMYYSCNTCTRYIYTGLCYTMNVIVCLGWSVRDTCQSKKFMDYSKLIQMYNTSG